jgi:diacylglycerol kinase family enzyme
MTRPDRPFDIAAARVALVLNAASGKRNAESKEDEIRRAVEPHVRSFSTYSVRKGHAIVKATQMAVRDGADVVVALGGDGTQSAVAGVLAGGSCVMAVLPGGTFNYFARGLGVGETLDQAIRTLLTGRLREIDLGEVNGHIFLNNASFGIYPEILEHREAIYRQWGRSRIAAYWSVLVALRDLRDPMHLTLTVGNQTRDFHTPLAFAARSPFQLEALGLDGADAVKDGHFALFLAKGTSRLTLMAAAVRLALGRVSRGQEFDMLTADDILIETSQPTRLVAFDGEKTRLNSPFRLTMHRAALPVIVPQDANLKGGAAG